MKLKSSQRWAIGAITLTVLIACSPSAPPAEPPIPAPKPPMVSETTPSATPTSAPAAEQPGYAGEWAFVEAECGQATKTFQLSAERIDMTPGAPSCSVKSIGEEHPTGRSMIYTIKADCLAEGGASEDTFKLDFGASDTVMQLQLNSRAPVRLVRCPAP